MQDLTRDPAALVVIVIVAIAFLYFIIYQIRVRCSGLDAIAQITWIEDKETYDSDGVSHTRYYHVSYTTQSGRYVEGTLSNPPFGVKEGQLVHIKYIEEKPDNPVYIWKAKDS